jgi:Mn2+/Fe2+ NRAMP family transporter
MAIVTFIALFSSTFAVADGFPQVWKRAFELIKTDSDDTKSNANNVYIISLMILAIGSWIIISEFSSNIKYLLDFVTTISFVSAPIYAWLNYKVMMGSDIANENKPQGLFKLYTLGCLSVLTLFSVFFLWWKFIS